MTVRVFVLLGLTISIVRAETNDRPHLLPVGPNFDVDAPHASTYGRLCEKMLFTGSNWVIRYHEISESGETGLSITTKQDGRSWVTMKQTRPQLRSTVFFALGHKLNLNSALQKLELVSVHCEIPEKVVAAIRRYWLSLLSDVRRSERPPSSIIISNQVILFAKTPDGKTLAGKLPSDAYKYGYLHAAEDIAWNLVEGCGQQQKNQKKLFDKIEQSARESTDAMLNRGTKVRIGPVQKREPNESCQKCVLNN